MRRIRGGVAAASVVAAMALGAGCGGGSSPAPADPATAVPANAALYADATVRPQGALKSSLQTALSKLLGTRDLGSYITARLDRSLSKDNLTYAKDIAPWLGQRAAVFYASLGTHPKGAVVVQTSDSQAALDTFEKAAVANGAKPHADTYRGVKIEAAGDNSYAAIGSLVVSGPQSGVEAAVAASKGRSLADSKAYTSSIASAPADRVFTAWADPRSLIQAAIGQGSLTRHQAARITAAEGKSFAQPIAAWGEASNDSLAIEFSLAASKASSGGSLISGVPEGAWLAFGAHDVGHGIAKGINEVQSLAAAQPGNGSAALDRIREALGVDVGNIGKWLGDVSGYISGTSIFGLGGAIVLESRNEAASAKSLGQLQTAFEHDVDVITRPLGGGRTGFTVTPSGAPVQFVFEQRQGKVIAGLGQDSVDSALNPPSTLADSNAFKAASGGLDGLTASFYLDFQPITTLLDIPGVSTNPNLQLVQPYLDRLQYVIAGAGVRDGRLLARLVLGVKSGSGSSSSVASVGGPAYAAVMR